MFIKFFSLVLTLFCHMNLSAMEDSSDSQENFLVYSYNGNGDKAPSDYTKWMDNQIREKFKRKITSNIEDNGEGLNWFLIEYGGREEEGYIPKIDTFFSGDKECKLEKFAGFSFDWEKCGTEELEVMASFIEYFKKYKKPISVYINPRIMKPKNSDKEKVNIKEEEYKRFYDKFLAKNKEILIIIPAYTLINKEAINDKVFSERKNKSFSEKVKHLDLGVNLQHAIGFAKECEKTCNRYCFAFGVHDYEKNNNKFKGTLLKIKIPELSKAESPVLFGLGTEEGYYITDDMLSVIKKYYLFISNVDQVPNNPSNN